MKDKYKIEMVYEVYPNTYPPFKSFLEFMIKKNVFKVSVSIFKKQPNTPENVHVMPNYYLRSFLEKWHNLNPKYKKLKYPQIYWLKKKLDVVNLQNSFMYNHLTELLKIDKKNRPKIVISLVGGESYVKPWCDKKWISFYTDYGNLVDAFAVQSEDQKKYITKWGIQPNKTYVIPVSFGTKSDAKPKYPNENVMKIVSAYRMTWEKNIEGSVRFAKLLNEKGINFQYDIYGNGNDLGQLYYLVDKYNLTGKVNIMGNIDNAVLKKKMVEYDFFLQLSVCEALSASVIEAQSVGVPCIVSDSDGIKEAIIPNKTGLCAPYYDIDYFANETIALWKNKENYFQFSTHAIQYANDNYSLEVELERTIKMYNEII